MEKKLIPAPIDGKNIVSDFICDFMQDCNEYRNGHFHAIIGAPLESNKPYMCEWHDQDNWVRFTPIDIIGSKVTYADNKRLADEFCKDHDERLVLNKEVCPTGVLVGFYFIYD